MTRRFDKPAWLPGTRKIVYLHKPPPDEEDRSFLQGTADALAEGRATSSAGIVTMTHVARSS